MEVNHRLQAFSVCCYEKNYVTLANNQMIFHQLHDNGHTVQTSNSCTSRPDVHQWPIVQATVDNMSANKSSTPMTHVAWKSKIRSVLKSSMHLGPGSWVTVGSAVVYYAWADNTFSAGIKCRHCTCRVHSVYYREMR